MLNIIFCTAPRLGERLMEYTRKLAENTHVKTYTDGLAPRTLEYARLFGMKDAYRRAVIVLSVLETKDPDERQRMALQIRADFPAAHIVYITDSIDDVLRLTNENLRMSGCFIKTVGEREYDGVLMNIFAEHGRAGAEREPEPEEPSYTMVVGKHMQKFALGDILYFESLNKKVRIVTRSLAVDKPLEYYESLTRIENELKGYFLRCHSGYLINIKHISGVSYKDMTITLDGGSKVPFSQSHKKDLDQILNRSRSQKFQNSV